MEVAGNGGVFTGDHITYMTGVLARYRETVVNKSKYHMGMHVTHAISVFQLLIVLFLHISYSLVMYTYTP